MQEYSGLLYLFAIVIFVLLVPYMIGILLLTSSLNKPRRYQWGLGFLSVQILIDSLIVKGNHRLPVVLVFLPLVAGAILIALSWEDKKILRYAGLGVLGLYGLGILTWVLLVMSA
jgi:hypothetical protein